MNFSCSILYESIVFFNEMSERILYLMQYKKKKKDLRELRLAIYQMSPVNIKIKKF